MRKKERNSNKDRQKNRQKHRRQKEKRQRDTGTQRYKDRETKRQEDRMTERQKERKKTERPNFKPISLCYREASMNRAPSLTKPPGPAWSAGAASTRSWSASRSPASRSS